MGRVGGIRWVIYLVLFVLGKEPGYVCDIGKEAIYINHLYQTGHDFEIDVKPLFPWQTMRRPVLQSETYS